MSSSIEFDHVGKQYRLGLVSTRTLSHDLHRWWQTSVLKKEDPYLKIGEINDRSKAGNSEYVWALRDIDFKVEPGDVVGIIGKNGAGKSTLLKLLSKVTGPTVGTIRARGRIGTLLEVGTGFHPEMTGRENIYMNGAIMGMSKQEITQKLDEIVDFSGCERYIDTPVKRYSSGMTVRLGFAVAAHLDPEILVVDEVLAVGDAEFQKKAIGKMQDISRGEGRTVLFVSHNMASIQRLCKNGILLDKGTIAYSGPIQSTVQKYLSANLVQTEYINNQISLNDKLVLKWARVYPESDNAFFSDRPINIGFSVIVNQTVKDIVLGFNIQSSFQYPIARSDFNDTVDAKSLHPGEYECLFQIPPNTLSNGEYNVILDIAEKNVKNYAEEDSILTFNVEIGPTSRVNIYAEPYQNKTSIIHELWLKEFREVR